MVALLQKYGPCPIFITFTAAVLSLASSVALVVVDLLFSCFITAEKGEVATAKGDGEKKKECTTECKSRRRRDEKAPWALNYGSGEGGGVEKGRRIGGEKRAMYV